EHPPLGAKGGGRGGRVCRRARPAEPLTLHAVARLVTAGEREPPPRLAGPAAIEGVVDADTLYQRAAQLGLDYGPRFRTVRRIELLGRGEARAHLDPSVVGGGGEGYLVHPGLLYGALRARRALITGSHTDLAWVSFLPWRFGRVGVAAPFGRGACSAWLRMARVGTKSASADFVLFDESGGVVAALFDCWFRRIELTRRGA